VHAPLLQDVRPLGNQPSKILPVTFDSHFNATRLNVFRRTHNLGTSLWRIAELGQKSGVFRV
jgi:hypothetical protein